MRYMVDTSSPVIGVKGQKRLYTKKQLEQTKIGVIPREFCRGGLQRQHWEQVAHGRHPDNKRLPFCVHVRFAKVFKHRLELVIHLKPKSV